MFAGVIIVATLTTPAYQGVSQTLLYDHLVWTPRDRPSLLEIEEEMRRQGGFDSRSFPLYFRYLTQEPPGDYSEVSKGWWRRKRALCMDLVARSEGDRSAFVPVGIWYLNDGNGGAYTAPVMLAAIVSTPDERRDVMKAVRPLIDIGDAKQSKLMVLRLKLLARTGVVEDLEMLEKSLNGAAVKAEKGAEDELRMAITIMKSRLVTEGEKLPRAR